MSDATGLAGLPPIFMALVALAAATVWQTAGALILFRLTPARLAETWRFALAWFLWLPLSGTAVLSLVVTHLASRTVLLAGTGAILVGAAFSWDLFISIFADAHAEWAAWRLAAKPVERWLWRGGLALQLFRAIVAAHPQRHYDQLSYHLVVGHLVVRDGEPFTGALDPHVSFSGVVEYAFAWHQVWTTSPLLYVSLAQSAVMVATVPVLLFCGVRLASRTLGILGMLLLMLPAIIPESDVFVMAKPDGIVLTGIVVLLTLLQDAPDGWVFAAAGVTMLLLATKVTAAHAALGLGAALLVGRPSRGRFTEWWPVVAIGAVALALQLGKNTWLFGNPLYPAGASVFPSPQSDESTRIYWDRVALDGMPRWSGWLGPFVLAERNIPFAACLIAVSVVLFVRTRRPQTGAGLAPVVAFLLVVWATWPAFYGSLIAPRFVGGFCGALLVLLLMMLARVDAVAQRWLAVACGCAALFTAQLDISLPRVWQWNHTSAWEAFSNVWPTLRTASAINRDLHVSDTVVADRAEKLFFDERLLYDGPLGPEQNHMLAELRRSPFESAARYHVSAVVVDTTRPMSAAMAEIWRGLEGRGSVRSLPPDRVLESGCYFQLECAGR